MANVARSAKSARDWTELDLAAYNIRIERQDASTFFGIDQLPMPTVDPELLTVQDAQSATSNRIFELMGLMTYANMPPQAEESVVADFAVELFKQIGYAARPRIARTRRNVPFFTCGAWTHAQPDACLVDYANDDILLVVQEDKNFEDKPYTPEPALIAEAIAAFDCNNRRRPERLGLAKIEHKVMPGIVLNNTTPTFFKIPVTSGLAKHVNHGTYPSETTVVSAYRPSLPKRDQSFDGGIKPLHNRQVILSCYEAFKGTMGI